MALDYAAIGATVDDLPFQQRIIAALEAQVIVVNAESIGTANHVQRLQLMARVLTAPKQYAVIFAPLICSVAPISALSTTASATDANILSGVQAVWDGIALRGV